MLVPLFSEYNTDVNRQIFIKDKNAIILFRSDEDKNAEFMNSFKEAALKLNNEFIFTYVDLISPLNKNIAQFMGVTEDDLPILKAFVPAKEFKYECDTKPQ